MDERLKDSVRVRYGNLAKKAAAGVVGAGGCGSAAVDCCGSAGIDCCGSVGRLYDEDELRGLPDTAVESTLGCGNPVALAEMAPGETVLDLGSGGGLDAFLAARRVGPTGKVWGLDFTDEMLELARRNQRQAGLENVEFIKGDIENIPLPDGSVDVIVSNCVINLATDKAKVFREAFRVLRPGGRLAVSDTVFRGDRSLLPPELKHSVEAWGACVAGALSEEEYLLGLREAGFIGVGVEVTSEYTAPGGACCECALPQSLSETDRLPAGIRLASGFFRARKPGDGRFAVRAARPQDLAAVRRLLAACDLTRAGLEEQYPGGYAVAEGAGRVIGVAGLERYGELGLLRSVAVDYAWRGQGVGRALVEDRLERARAGGLKAVYLLTTDAADYFRSLGFTAVGRDSAPPPLAAAAEFAGACPATARLLVLPLTR